MRVLSLQLPSRCLPYLARIKDFDSFLYDDLETITGGPDGVIVGSAGSVMDEDQSAQVGANAKQQPKQ